MRNNTLHICNYSEITNKSFYLKLVGSNDSIVFYVEYLSKKQYDELLELLNGTSEKVYFVIENNKHNIPTIDNKGWLTLINNHKQSFTWK